VEAFQELANSSLETFDSALGGGAEKALEFGERQFDRIEVRTVGGQIDQLCPDAFDRFGNARHLVSRQVVHHDDVASAKRGRKLLLNVAEKHVAVHRPVDHSRRRETSQPQRADERGRLPVSMRDVSDDALAAKGPAIETGQLRVGPAFIEKGELSRVQMRLPESPSLSAIGNVRA